MVRTHYDNLKIARAASSEEIRRAYRVLAQKWHPDKNTHRVEEAENNIKIINEAYRVLSNPELRQDHDEWVRSQESAHPGEYTSAYDDQYRRYYGAEDYQFRRKRKRSKQTEQSFRVSKKKFAYSLIALFAIPSVIGVVVLNADSFSSFIAKAPIAMSPIAMSPIASANKPESVAKSADLSKEVEKGLFDFFAATSRTLSFITDTDTAIAAVPRLKQSESYVIEFSEHLESADSTIKSSASKAAAEGLRELKPQFYRLQKDTRIWDILYPTLSPMITALRRMSDTEAN